MKLFHCKVMTNDKSEKKHDFKDNYISLIKISLETFGISIKGVVQFWQGWALVTKACIITMITLQTNTYNSNMLEMYRKLQTTK